MLTNGHFDYSLRAPGNRATPLYVPVFSIGRPNIYVALCLTKLSVSRLHSAGGEFMNENGGNTEMLG